MRGTLVVRMYEPRGCGPHHRIDLMPADLTPRGTGLLEHTSILHDRLRDLSHRIQHVTSQLLDARKVAHANRYRTSSAGSLCGMSLTLLLLGLVSRLRRSTSKPLRCARRSSSEPTPTIHP